MRAAKSLRTVPVGLSKEEAWLVSVLVNIRRDQWRRVVIQQRSAQLLRVEVTPRASIAESALMTKQTVWRALDTLPPRRRAIVILHELEGLSLPAIASVLGVSGVTVRWHLSIAARLEAHSYAGYRSNKMKTLQELLREADPLGFEPGPSRASNVDLLGKQSSTPNPSRRSRSSGCRRWRPSSR